MNRTVLGNIAVGSPYSEARLQNNLEAWASVYADKLREVRSERPELYAWPDSETDAVLARMLAAFAKDSYNIDSLAIKRTCKHFGIKHTRKAIREVLRNGDAESPALRENQP